MSSNTFGRGQIRLSSNGAAMATRGLTKNEIIHLGPTHSNNGHVLNAAAQLSPNLSYNRTAECFQSRLTVQGSMAARDFIHPSNDGGSNMANGHIHNHQPPPFNNYGYHNQQHHQASLFNGASSPNEYATTAVHQGHHHQFPLPDPQQVQWPFEDPISTTRRPSQWSLTQDQEHNAQSSLQMQVRIEETAVIKA